jgi:predicted nucleic acid-binding protein
MALMIHMSAEHMKIYLDNCALQRPLDDKSHTRIRLEAEAILSILAVCEAGEIDLISSEALTFEFEKNPLTARRDYAISALASATVRVAVNDKIENRADEFVHHGIHPLDALHLASAEEAGADYFCTCDDRFFKLARSVENLKTFPVTPLELIEELGL